MGVVKRFSDGSFLEFAQGNFDKWCVYVTTPNGLRRPPLDRNYFSFLQQLGAAFGPRRVYDDFVRVYDRTGKTVDSDVFSLIASIAAEYPEYTLRVEQVLSILYLTMIAEENKAYTRLGKRIKRLGIHCLLLEDLPVEQAADFTRGMNWRSIADMCQQRGF